MRFLLCTLLGASATKQVLQVLLSDQPQISATDKQYHAFWNGHQWYFQGYTPATKSWGDSVWEIPEAHNDPTINQTVYVSKRVRMTECGDVSVGYHDRTYFEFHQCGKTKFRWSMKCNNDARDFNTFCLEKAKNIFKGKRIKYQNPYTACYFFHGGDNRSDLDHKKVFFMEAHVLGMKRLSFPATSAFKMFNRTPDGNGRGGYGDCCLYQLDSAAKVSRFTFDEPKQSTNMEHLGQPKEMKQFLEENGKGWDLLARRNVYPSLGPGPDGKGKVDAHAFINGAAKRLNERGELKKLLTVKVVA